MKDKYEISSIEEVKSLLQRIEPQLENLIKSFYRLKELADKKFETDALLKSLDLQFQELSKTLKKFKSSDSNINNFLNSINDITRRDVINNGSMTQNRNLDFFRLMDEYSKNNRFNYACWGKMNKRIQQFYLRIYSYYSKCTYELIKKGNKIDANDGSRSKS